MPKRNIIKLNTPERARLSNLISSGSAPARQIKHANVLRWLTENRTYQEIAITFDLTERTVIRIKQRFEQEGLEAVLLNKPRSGAPRKLDGAVCAVLVATACTPAPAGYADGHSDS